MKVADMHCDTIGEIYENRLLGNNYKLKKNNFHVDINKLKKGNYLLQNFAMFIDIKKHKKPYKTLQEMIAVYYEELEDNKDIIIGLINGVMKNTDISNEFIIKVSPEDYKFLVNNQGKIYCSVSKEVTMDIVEDATMKKNQCIIESDTGVYDCSLDIELNNLIEDIKLLSCL